MRVPSDPVNVAAAERDGPDNRPYIKITHTMNVKVISGGDASKVDSGQRVYFEGDTPRVSFDVLKLGISSNLTVTVSTWYIIASTDPPGSVAPAARHARSSRPHLATRGGSGQAWSETYCRSDASTKSSPLDEARLKLDCSDYMLPEC